MSSSKTVQKESKFAKCMRASLRGLAMSLTGCAGELTYGNASSYPAPVIPTLPRSFSMNSNFNDHHQPDYRDLIRFASARNLTGKTEKNSFMPRSKSVAIPRMRIKEHETFDEEDEVGLLRAGPKVYSRSRSCAFSTKCKIVL